MKKLFLRACMHRWIPLYSIVFMILLFVCVSNDFWTGVYVCLAGLVLTTAMNAIGLIRCTLEVERLSKRARRWKELDE